MFGVIIWSDPDAGKAVIWCEDHGDLAFYRESCSAHFVRMEAGDLVEFTLTHERAQRIVLRPKLVAEGAYDGLSRHLADVGNIPCTPSDPATATMHLGDDPDVLPFQKLQRPLSPPCRHQRLKAI